MEARYVVLHHTGHPDKPDHYDLMIERDGCLKTWVLSSPELDGTATESFDHRMAYLTHEGEIEGGRGTVVRVAKGVFRIERWSKKQIVLAFGEGTVLLATDTGGEGSTWRLSRKSK